MAVWQIYRYRATLRKKLHRTNQGSNFAGDNFSNRDYVRAPILFRRERQPQPLKRWFFLKNRPIHFHINSASVIRAVKRNKLSFSSVEMKKSTVSHRSDSSSVAISSCCHRSDACSHLKCSVVPSAQIAIVQMASSERSLMYSRKSLRLRKEP